MASAAAFGHVIPDVNLQWLADSLSRKSQSLPPVELQDGAPKESQTLLRVAASGPATRAIDQGQRYLKPLHCRCLRRAEIDATRANPNRGHSTIPEPNRRK